MGSTEPFPKPLTFTLTCSSHHSRGRWAGLGISPCLQITMLLAWGHMARCMAESGLKPGSPEAHVDIFQNTSLLISLIPKILFLKKKDLQRSPVPLNLCLRFLGPQSRAPVPVSLQDSVYPSALAIHWLSFHWRHSLPERGRHCRADGVNFPESLINISWKISAEITPDC